MSFLRARTEEQIASRQEEIINAAEALFSQYGYEGVNFKAISALTSFTRPSIYNYYETKDEVLLDLLKREIMRWQACVIEVMNTTAAMTKEQYSAWMTQTFSSHGKMLKLLSILFSVLEKNSSIEKLGDFKKEVAKALRIFEAGVDKYFPAATAENKAIFLSAFFPYILGLYPMSHVSQKQHEASQRTGGDWAGVGWIEPDFEHMCYHGILLLLSDL